MLVSTHLSSQACFRIESILVDACGSPEGPNEMVRIKIGPNSLNTSALQITWPNTANPYLGICQTPQTASKIAVMNSQIQACGYFVEPVNGVLPANSTVLIITSTDFDQNAHNYAGLSDTLYVIFQCNGNTTGHFANWIDGCNPATGNRTTTINFVGFCQQQVTYNRCNLTNQTGGVGGTAPERDGARVDFATNGVATYANDGCTIPYTPLSVNANFVSGQNTFCANETIAVQATVNGSGEQPLWTSTDGTFSDPASLLTFFTPHPGSTGTITLQFTSNNGCGDPVSISLQAILLPEPVVQLNTTYQQSGCQQTALITASGATSYQWNTGATSAQITVNQSGIYTVIGTNNCGTDEQTIQVELSANEINFTVSPDTMICPGNTAYLSATGDFDFQWTPQSDVLFQEDAMVIVQPIAPTLYTVIATDASGCQGTQTVFVDFFTLPQLTISPNEFGFLGDTFQLWANSNASGTYSWSPTEYLSCVNCQEPVSLPNQSMLYTATFVDSNGCITSAEVHIRLESTLYIPNSFTPNNDGLNDVFRIGGADLDEFTFTIFNRWGEQVISLHSYDDEWDGTYKGKLSPEGVYPWVLRFRDNDGLEYERTGHIALIRRGY